MKLAAMGSSVIGPFHLQEKMPNQDAMAVHGIHGGWCITVSDGLGSRSLSHIGSKKATRLVRAQIRAHSRIDTAPPLTLSQKIQKDWINAFSNRGEHYETTCLWAWVNDKGWGKSAQVGDGLVLIKTRGEFIVLTPQRNGYGNQTQTLARAEKNDWSTAEFKLSTVGDGVLVMTDGISDDLIPEELDAFFDAVFQQLKRTNKRRCKKWLNQELKDWSTPKHGDDKSIAGIFRVE